MQLWKLLQILYPSKNKMMKKKIPRKEKTMVMVVLVLKGMKSEKKMEGFKEYKHLSHTQTKQSCQISPI